MSRFAVRQCLLNKGLQLGDLAGLQSFVADHFRVSSGGDVDLAFEAGWTAVTQAEAGIAVSSLDLHNALAILTGNPKVGPASTLGVVFAHSYMNAPNMYGLMFDRGFATSDDANYGQPMDVPRQGCAIFLGSLLRDYPAQADFEKRLHYTSTHEFGHVFNLVHQYKPASFMRQTKDGIDSNCFFFDPDQQEWLSNCTGNLAVCPGGSDFRDTGPSFDVGRKTRSAFGDARLKIDVFPKTFYAYEPVQLNITISALPAQGIWVPAECDPGYDSFRIFIETPVGERYLYRPPAQFCAGASRLHIRKGKPFRRDLSLLGAAGGYTFRHAGHHRIHVEFQVRKNKILISNSVEMTIKPSLSLPDHQQKIAALLRRFSVAAPLFYGSQLSAPAQLTRFRKAIAELPAIPETALARYLAARITWKSIEGGNARRSLRARLKRDLDRILQQDVLGDHQTRRALEMYQQIAEQPT